MAKSFISPSRSTNKTINAIDRKRERERRRLLIKAKEEAASLAVSLVQRLLDRHIIETTSEQAIRESMEKQLRSLIELDEFDFQYKIAPLRSLTPDPNVVSLALTQFIIEDLVEHPKINDVFGDDLDVYRAVHSIISRLGAESGV